MVVFHSLRFINSFHIDLTRLAIWWWKQEFYFLFQSEAGFSHFLYKVALRPDSDTGEYFIYDSATHFWKAASRASSSSSVLLCLPLSLPRTAVGCGEVCMSSFSSLLIICYSLKSAKRDIRALLFLREIWLRICKNTKYIFLGVSSLFVLFVVVLRHSNISDHIRMGTDL